MSRTLARRWGRWSGGKRRRFDRGRDDAPLRDPVPPLARVPSSSGTPPIVIGGGSYLDQLATWLRRNVFHDPRRRVGTVSSRHVARDPDVFSSVRSSGCRVARRREWRAIRRCGSAASSCFAGRSLRRPSPPRRLRSRRCSGRSRARVTPCSPRTDSSSSRIVPGPWGRHMSVVRALVVGHRADAAAAGRSCAARGGASPAGASPRSFRPAADPFVLVLSGGRARRGARHRAARGPVLGPPARAFAGPSAPWHSSTARARRRRQGSLRASLLLAGVASVPFGRGHDRHRALPTPPSCATPSLFGGLSAASWTRGLTARYIPIPLSSVCRLRPL